jgi:hypothetical protein
MNYNVKIKCSVDLRPSEVLELVRMYYLSSSPNSIVSYKGIDINIHGGVDNSGLYINIS